MPKVKRKKQPSKSRVDIHHVTPRSRLPDGSDKDKDNIVWWDKRFHERWHSLFANMTLAETIKFIMTISRPGDAWPAGRLAHLRDWLMRDKRPTSRRYDMTIEYPNGSVTTCLRVDYDQVQHLLAAAEPHFSRITLTDVS